MIPPHTRSLLTDALTPPAGMRFDSGVVTTYSLDPIALLSVPLHLAWHGLGGRQEQLADPVLLVEALNRVVGRLTVFSQRGRMQAPARPHQLYGLLDGMIHEAIAPLKGAFHAKLWLLRFVSEDGDKPLLRLLIPSRNLTADRSWDLCLHMEGRPERTRIKANEPLADFISTLPTWSERPMTDERATLLKTLRSEVWRCSWELPGDFTQVRFHVLGASRKPVPWLPPQSDELGVISPFLGENALKELCKTTTRPLFLLSRGEEMDKQPGDGLRKFERLLTLNPQAEASDAEDEPRSRLHGLHAKAYVLKCGWNAHLILGSANATSPALLGKSEYTKEPRGNVEILVELIGRYSKIGRPDTWLSGDKGLLEILLDYMPPLNPVKAEAPTLEEIRLEEASAALVSLGMELHCEQEGDAWSLALHAREAFDPGDILLDVRLFTTSADRATVLPILRPSQPTRLGAYSAAEITSLAAFRLRLGGKEIGFALNLALLGGPEDREAAILGLILRNREAFVRYLLLLLADGDQAPTAAVFTNVGSDTPGDWRGGCADDIPLFEMLARTWAREPERLKEVTALVARLRGTADDCGEPVLPVDFLEVWSVFEAAMAKEAEHDA